MYAKQVKICMLFCNLRNLKLKRCVAFFVLDTDCPKSNLKDQPSLLAVIVYDRLTDCFDDIEIVQAH